MLSRLTFPPSLRCVVYLEGDSDPPSPMSPSLGQEMHRFVLQRPGGGSLQTEQERQALADVVRACLLGTRPLPISSALWPTAGGGGESVVPGGPPRGNLDKDVLLRTMSGKWKGLP